MFIKRLEVLPTLFIPTPDNFLRYIMAALLDTIFYPLNCNLYIRKIQEDQFYAVTYSLPFGDHLSICLTAQGGFKSKAFAVKCMAVDFLDHEPACLENSFFGKKWRNASCNQISIHEDGAASLIGQKLAGKSCFSCAVRSGNDDYLFPFNQPSSSLSHPSDIYDMVDDEIQFSSQRANSLSLLASCLCNTDNVCKPSTAF